MEIKEFLIYIIGFAVFVFLARYLVLTHLLLGYRMEVPVFRRLERKECPGYIQEFYELKEKELLDLGFQYLYSYMSETRPVKTLIYKSYFFVYYQPYQKTYATLSSSDEADYLLPYAIRFSTYFENGQKLMTINNRRHMMMGEIPGVIVQDAYTTNLEQQWHFHRHNLEKLNDQEPYEFAATPPGFDQMLELEREKFQQYLESLQQLGRISRIEENVYLAKTLPAMIFAHKALSGLNKTLQMKRKLMLQQAEQKKKGLPVETIDIPLELEAGYFNLANATMASNRGNLGGKLLLLFITMVLFVVAFGLVFNFRMAWLLLGVISLHELGHLAAMSLFGYKDLKMLFVPLFGAVAMGTAKNVAPYKKVITYFAGPLPGIILGFVLLWMFRQGTLPHFFMPYAIPTILLLIIVNYFNLLPIFPLDGGQVLNTVIFSRFALLQFIFFLFSIAGLGLLGIYLKSPVMIILAVLIPFGYRNHFTMRKLTARIETQLEHQQEVSDGELVQTIFSELKKEEYKKETKNIFHKKIQLARYVEENFREAKASLTTVIITLVLYIAVFVIPIVFYILPRLSSPGSFFYGSKTPSGFIQPYHPGKVQAKDIVKNEVINKIEGKKASSHI